MKRRVPDEAIFHLGRRVPAGAERPDFDVLPRPRPRVEAHDDADAAPRSRRGRPNEIRVHRVGRRPAALAAVDVVPLAARDAAPTAAGARTAIRRTVLLVAVDVIGNP